MAKGELTRLSAVELARLIRTEKASPVEVTEAHLAATGKITPAVNAFCTVAAEKALAWARDAERAVKKRAKLGTLHGVPVAIKDLTITAGIRTTFGSTLYRDHVPTEDAEVVRRLKAAGAIVLGKTNTPEFGAGANTVNKVFGATRNPWNTALSASRSTGGGAAALAARLATIFATPALRSTRSRSTCPTGAMRSSRCAARPWRAITCRGSSGSASSTTISRETSARGSRSPWPTSRGRNINAPRSGTAGAGSSKKKIWSSRPPLRCRPSRWRRAIPRWSKAGR